MGLDAKNFLVLNSIFNSSPVKTTEVEKVTVTGPTNMMGTESISQEQADNRDIPVFNQATDRWEFMNIDDLLIENKTIKDIIIKGVTQGGYSEGITIPKGTSFEDIIQKMLTLVIPANYVAPTCNINGSEIKTLEAGTIINPTITPSFIKNDAGDINRYLLQKKGITVKDTATLQTFTDSNLLVGDEIVNFRATMFYNNGPIKNNNLDEPSPIGQIKTGSIFSNTVNYVGVRNLFFGCSTNNNPISNNEEIRSLNKKEDPTAGTALTLNIPAGTKKIIIAYPSTIRDVSSIKYVEGLNAEIKSIFQKSLLNISGANNYNPIEYKVFVYIPDVPFSNNVTYNIVI